MIPELLRLIPPHVQYVEAFTGGGTLFWVKPPSHNEVINDMNTALTNFYWQCKTNFKALQEKIQATLHSEHHYLRSKEIVKDETADPLERAWALWVQTSMTFSSIICGGFAFGTTGCGFTTHNRRMRFTDQYEKRLEHVEIFCRDAVELIELKDHPDTFFYVDPPYVSSNQGHYDGYTSAHFLNLLNLLQNIKGKFLLSSYPEPDLLKYREMLSVDKMGIERGWRWKDIEQTVAVSGKRDGQKKKIECLTWNYPEPAMQHSLFSDMTEKEAYETEEHVPDPELSIDSSTAEALAEASTEPQN